MKKDKFFHYSLLGAFLLLSYNNCSNSGFQVKNNGQGPIIAQSVNDPYYPYAWHLHNTGQNVFAVNSGVAGFDLNLQSTWSSGNYGNGIRILISDSGVEDTHEDLLENFNYAIGSKDYTLTAPYNSSTGRPKQSSDYHGTNVAGIIVGVMNNGKGSTGVAPKAIINSANVISGSVSQTVGNFVDALQPTYDIVNMSWGIEQNIIPAPDTTYENALKNVVLAKRGNKGAIIIKASGNDFFVKCNASSDYCIGNTNFDPDNTTPYLINTAALNAEGLSSSYSSPGSSLWISAYGGEFAYDSPAMITTDQMGCSVGKSVSSQTTLSGSELDAYNLLRAFELNTSPTTCASRAGNYTASFNGTSAAAPTLSGAVALILKANPNLTWRDVKYILAVTAKNNDLFGPNMNSHPLNSFYSGYNLPSGYVWENGWITNGAGFRFHNWYGFGRVDVDAAVQLAKNYSVNLGTYTETNWLSQHSASSLDRPIPDNSAAGVTHTLTVNSVDNVRIEAVQIKIDITHPDISEIGIELTSPSGTKSILVNALNSLSGIPDYLSDRFLSNAFFQENAQGTWTIKIVDGKSGDSGKLNSWSLNFIGGR